MPIQWNPGSYVTLMDTELNSLANNTSVNDGADWDNNASGARYLQGDFYLSAQFGTAPAAGSVVQLFARKRYDGTNLTDDADQNNGLVGVFEVRAVTTRQYIPLSVAGVDLSPCIYRFRVRNIAGQAFSSSGNLLILMPFRMESV